MSESPAPPESEQPERARSGRSADAALASSAPDQLTVVMKVVRTLLKPGPWQFARLFIAGTLLLTIVLALFGVPAILALQALIDKWLDYKSAERESVTPAVLEQIRDDSAATRRAAEGAELGTRMIAEDVQRMDRRVQRIEDAHPNLPREQGPEK